MDKINKCNAAGKPISTKQMKFTIRDLYIENSPWNFAVEPIIVSPNHHILYNFPAHKTHLSDDSSAGKQRVKDFILMPHSPQNTFRIKTNDGTIRDKSCWEVIENSLTTRPIKSLTEFQNALNSYRNQQLPHFQMLEYFFTDKNETVRFFNDLLPKIITLALQLPDVMPTELPILKATGSNQAISFSQMQIASLLANAFLCTFPESNTKTIRSLPAINFTRFFIAQKRDHNVAKLKCILHYFTKVANQGPTGYVTFERKFCGKDSVPRWNQLDDTVLGNVKLHVNSTGTIEDCDGFLQMDFADMYIGGYVLGSECLQEEIRFSICPELIISRLFTERITDNEAVIVTGAERFSNYRGYDETFTWNGNYQDTTPLDAFNRRRCTITAIDAIHLQKVMDPSYQFRVEAILRELNKAYVGFKSSVETNVAPVATGNWGCGAFNGNIELKFLIQLMACAATNRNMAYCTVGDVNMMNTIQDCYAFLKHHQITISKMWCLLCGFHNTKQAAHMLYPYIKQTYLSMIKQPTSNQQSSVAVSQPTTSMENPSEWNPVKKEDQ